MNKLKLAIYDLDHTLYRKDTFFLFYIFLIREGCVPFRNLVLFLYHFVLYLLGRRSRTDLKEKVLKTLSGKKRYMIEGLVDKFYMGLNKKHFRPELLQSVEKEKTEGYFLVLLTASPDIYANRIGAVLGFSKTIATKTVFQLDTYLGKIQGDNIKGEMKIRALQEELNLDACDLQGSVGYGNKDDMPWLNLLGERKVY